MKKTISNPRKIMRTLPHDVLAYVKSYYPQGMILNMTEDNDIHGMAKYYDVDIVSPDNTYHLRFDEQGRFMHENIEYGKLEEQGSGSFLDFVGQDEFVTDKDLVEI